MTSDIPSVDAAPRSTTGPIGAHPGTPAIRLRGIEKRYRLGSRCVEALRGIDLVIDEPGFYAIMGPSGSGKSTLLHLIAGLDQPDAGSVEVAGDRLDAMTERQLTLFRRRRVGIVFQQFNLIPTMTALENVTLPGLLDGMNRAKLKARGARLLDSLGLAERGDHRPDALSGGEQQRVAIARALLFEPLVLLADEPTGNLDSASSDQLWTLIEELAASRRMTVIMVTHEPAAAIHCRCVYLLRDGRIAESFNTEHHDAAELATRAQQLRR
jgi:putative ABC transport system ATP-binding protein